MEKINELLVQLENKVTANIAKRIEVLKKLNERVALAEAEHTENPTDESEESLTDIKEYVSEVVEDLIEDLKGLIELKKQPIEEKAPEQKAPVATEETKTEVVKEKKKGLGVFGLILGVVVLVGSVGAFNIMKSNR
jgi:hypothetical protein